ncbi:MAG: CYTH domain-containing protein [Lachnospiraceae bacterium]
MEIERKFLISALPDWVNRFPFHTIEQGYLCTDPVVRIRRQDEEYILTYKSKGLMVREEYNLPLTANSYSHLKEKADGRFIYKQRFLIPLSNGLTAELDVFQKELAPLLLVEVEFSTQEEATLFVPPDWFGEEVTFSSKYHNSHLSCLEN